MKKCENYGKVGYYEFEFPTVPTDLQSKFYICKDCILGLIGD